MDTVLRKYDAGNLRFRAMLDQLESYVDQVSDDEFPWKQSFRNEWGTLEELYAHASFKGLKAIPESDMPMIEAALSELKRMIAEKL